MNISNQLTLSRIVLVFFALMLASVQSKYPGIYPYFDLSDWAVQRCHEAALIIAFLAGITDYLDGYLARKLNQVTDFGKLMDPLADKVFITAVFLILVESKLVPSWIAVTIISREFMVTGLRVLAASKKIIIPADRWGKLKTALQMTILAIGGAVWVQWLPIDLLQPTTHFDSLYRVIWHLSLWAIVAITVGSGAGYFWRYRSLYAKDW